MFSHLYMELFHSRIMCHFIKISSINVYKRAAKQTLISAVLRCLNVLCVYVQFKVCDVITPDRHTVALIHLFAFILLKGHSDQMNSYSE